MVVSLSHILIAHMPLYAIRTPKAHSSHSGQVASTHQCKFPSERLRESPSSPYLEKYALQQSTWVRYHQDLDHVSIGRHFITWTLFVNIDVRSQREHARQSLMSI